MINKGYFLQRFFQEVRIETPAQGWRRADDTLIGGVNSVDTSCQASGCQVNFTRSPGRPCSEQIPILTVSTSILA